MNPRACDPNLRALLEHMVRIDASQLLLTAEAPPVFRVAGEMLPCRIALDAARVDAMLESFLAPTERAELAHALQLDLTLCLPDLARFRVSLFHERGRAAAVFGLVRSRVRSLHELGLPPLLAGLALERRGLILIVGAAGDGVSTTVAGMIDHRNQTQPGHILTVEDPIRFVHAHKRSLVTQREIGTDTRSFEDALRSAARQAPDLLVIDRLRDAGTMAAALDFVDSGRLCLATLYAADARQALERLLHFFPDERRAEVRLHLSLHLRALVCQHLIPSLPTGRVPALEVVLGTPRVRRLVEHGNLDGLDEALRQDAPEGACRLDESLWRLAASGRIAREQAVASARDPRALEARLEDGGVGSSAETAPLHLARASDPMA